MSLQQLDQERQSRIEAPLIAELSNTFAQLRAELVRAQTSATNIDKYHRVLEQQESVFDAQIQATCARLAVIQDSIRERLDGIEGREGDEILRQSIARSLDDLREIADLKATSIFKQARSRELLPGDPVPFGSYKYLYDKDGNKSFSILQQTAAPITSGGSYGSARTASPITSAPINPYSAQTAGAVNPYGAGPASQPSGAQGLPTASPHPYTPGAPAPGLPGVQAQPYPPQGQYPGGPAQPYPQPGQYPSSPVPSAYPQQYGYQYPQQQYPPQPYY